MLATIIKDIVTVVCLHSIPNQNSDNSSLTPSTDQNPSKKKANEYNGRQAPERKTGGQKGHPGTSLSKKSIEEKICSGEFHHAVENWVNGAPVAGDTPDTDYISHYVIDLTILAEAKEMRFYADADGNHHIPKKYLSEVIYGDTITSLVVVLYSEGNVSLQRIRKLIASLSGQAITISEGSIFHF